MAALRPRARGVYVEISAGVSVAIALGVEGSIALELLKAFASGLNAAMKKLHDDEEG